VNLLLAICGDDIGRMHCHEQWMDGGTTVERFNEFIDGIMSDIEQNHLERSFIIIMDNLSSHWDPEATGSPNVSSTMVR
jgi:hypothetical protein